jgi:hypothetical protein
MSERDGGDEDDEGGRTLSLGGEATVDPMRELDEVLGDLEALLKNGDVGSALAERGVNTSLALVAVEGLRAYLHGAKAQAADDLGTVAEEIAGRLARSAEAAAAGRREGDGHGGDGGGTTER